VKRQPQTLILGWGNRGRGDDGLGPEFVHAMEELGLPGVVANSDYQLQVEDAAEVSRYRRVIFVDADRQGAEPFWMGRLHPAASGVSFSTHSVSPAAVLALARDLFRSEPAAWILGIRGDDDDELIEQWSPRARCNMDQAVDFLKSAVCEGGLQEIRSRAVKVPTATDDEGDPCQTSSP
jgi:hydrogenase maturation protease